ncbi:MAG TPA: type II toxin-antitoxin system VapC family toxin [Gemmatimonadaceae bacterium]|nr:type II toxin-antitoxin system VapC family toxin [Gemmatimonadaceae bacterium]
MGRPRVTRVAERPSESPVSGAPRIAPRVWTPADLHDYEGPLLLDTHVWLWHVEGNSSHFAPGTTALLDRSGAHSRLFVSDISYWEVAVKAAKGKLSFSVDVAVWLQRAEEAPGIRFRPLTRPVLLQSTRLGGTAHNDPADRMLIAMAQLDSVPLVTGDRLIIEYARAQRGTPVVDVRA